MVRVQRYVSPWKRKRGQHCDSKKAWCISFALHEPKSASIASSGSRTNQVRISVEAKARVVTLKSTLRSIAPRMIRPYRILRGPLRGRIIFTSLHDYPGAILGHTEKALLTWFRQNVKPNETWLDVGAHYGYTMIALAELVGGGGAVYVFEPALTTVGYLNRTRTLNKLHQVTVVPFGLAEPGNLHSVSMPIDRGMVNNAFGGVQFENVYMIGFDQLWTMLGERPVHGVKIDVQGMELQTLAGMEQTLTRHRPKLVIELHSGVDRQSIKSFVRSMGYHLPGVAVDPLPGETEAAYQDDRSYAFQPSIE